MKLNTILIEASKFEVNRLEREPYQLLVRLFVHLLHHLAELPEVDLAVAVNVVPEINLRFQ